MGQTLVARSGGEIVRLHSDDNGVIAWGAAAAAALPIQLQPPAKLHPEKTLMLAVLVDGLRCAAGLAGGRYDSMLVVRDARLWRDSSEIEWPFSFLALCDALALDAQAIREASRAGCVNFEHLHVSRHRRGNHAITQKRGPRQPKRVAVATTAG